MKSLLEILAIISVIWINGCNTTEPPDPPPPVIKPTLTLAFDDTSCTEAWLQLTTKDLTLPAELTLKQYNPTGDSVTQTFSLSTADTLLYIDSLLPNQNYKFKVLLNTSNLPQPTTNFLTVTTMDTTSHNFTFESWTFGTVGSSVLYDVAIINENNIWAVGEIMIADTSQNGYTTYNAVYWDGSEWTLHKLYFYTIPGQQDTGVYEARSILAFDENNIWITSGSQITKWDGVRQTFRHSSPVYVNKLWGTDNNNIYAVGYNGQIARYNGTNWQRIESGTTLNINDIWGDFNEKTQEWEILAVASNILQSFEKEVLQIYLNNALTLNKNGIDETLSGLWFKTNKKYFVAGSGIYEKRKLNESFWKGDPLDITQYFIYKIRGQEINDLIATGGVGEVLHFNGMTWKSYFYEAGLVYGNYYSTSINGNTIAVVGVDSPRAAITIGKRIN